MTKPAAYRAVLALLLAATFAFVFSEPLSARKAIRIGFAPVEEQEAWPPAAWPDYCARHPDDCAVNLTQPLQVLLTPQLRQTIQAIDSLVNAALQPMTDLDHWGVEDHWDLAEDGYGDCEDYQLLKRQMLLKAGLPRRAMLMTVVRDKKGAGHALLMIRTNQGDLILDNMRDEVLLWSETGYTFLKRESQYFSGWVTIDAAE
jgi:predicted transglutaminase-like cysteine proteinase